MIKFATGALLAGVAAFALGGTAFAAGIITDAEFKCQASVSKAGSKFVGSKAKCAAKCIALAGKTPPQANYSDCFVPYGGATATCISEPTFRKGAEEKFEDAIRKACDPSFKAGTDCPECYSGGDCSLSGEATNRQQNIEGQVDSFGPGVYCEQPGADAFETKCEQSTAKALVKVVGSVNKCYDKCNSNQRKALIPPGSCTPPSPSDPTGATQACIAKSDAKGISSIDKACGPECFNGSTTCGDNSGTCSNDSLVLCGCDADCGDQSAAPDCSNPDDYPTGSAWVNLVEIAISGNVPGTYCASPSGAFLQ